MKKLIIIFIITGGIFSSCKKDPATVSKIVDVTYPAITLNGPAYVHLSVGEAYTDLGAVLTDDITGASSPISPKESNIDNTTPGIYKVVYEASNANGFKTTALRTILVLDYTPPSGLDPNFDISGLWQRTNGIYVNLFKLDNGLYIIDNFAGSTLIYPAYLLTPDTTTVDIPAQTSFDGFALDCYNESFDNTPPATMSWKVDAAGFGTGTRTFIKQ